MDWSEFDNMVDDKMLEKIKDLESGKQNSEHPEVPHGEYDVVVEKLELGVSKKGNPMTTVWLRIIEGQWADSIIFANLVMSKDYGIFNTKKFVKSLQPSVPVVFENFTQWDILIKGIAEELCDKYIYTLKYGQTINKKGEKFPSYIITGGPYELDEEEEEEEEE